MKKTIVVAFLLLLTVGLFLTACQSKTDACKETFDSCNYSCGEGGVKANLCKEKCTKAYNDCMVATG